MPHLTALVVEMRDQIRDTNRLLERLIRLQERQNAISYTVEEAAEILHCSESRVYELFSKPGGLEEAPSFGRGRAVSAASVQRLAREGLPEFPPKKQRDFRINPKKIKI
jgi:hypothetical protein